MPMLLELVEEQENESEQFKSGRAKQTVKHILHQLKMGCRIKKAPKTKGKDNARSKR